MWRDSFSRDHIGSTGLRLLAVLGILLGIEVIYAKLWSSEARDDHGLHNLAHDLDAWKHPYSEESESTPLHPGVHENETQHWNNGANVGDFTRTIVCPALKGLESDTDWIHDMFPHWDRSIYVVNDPHGNLTVAKNKGREASVYLTYLISHYHALPNYIVFIHGKRYQWHSDDPMYDTAPEIANLNLAYVAEHGYTSLRCHWYPGCPTFLTPKPQGIDGFFDIDRLYADAFLELFPDQPIPTAIGAPCCAQFAVTREQVRKRPVSDYERFRQWLWDSEANSMKSGYVMEYMWHMLFGKEPVFCEESAQNCYCKKFGHCDLICPHETFCNGRAWNTPFDHALPEDWPAPEVQGKNGWPADGWWYSELPGFSDNLTSTAAALFSATSVDVATTVSLEPLATEARVPANEATELVAALPMATPREPTSFAHSASFPTISISSANSSITAKRSPSSTRSIRHQRRHGHDQG